jgi:hypothetical protein
MIYYRPDIKNRNYSLLSIYIIIIGPLYNISAYNFVLTIHLDQHMGP